MNVIPYINFDGRCEEALEFYRKAVGARVQMMMRNGEAPERPPMERPGTEDKVLHVSFFIGDTLLQGSDGYCNGRPNFQGISLSINVATPAEADRVFKAISEGGKVNMPLAKTFFSPAFGMCADKFGMQWMVLVPQPM